MPNHSFFKTITVIITIFLGLGLVLFGFNVYVQYRAHLTTNQNANVANNNPQLNYVAPEVDDDPSRGLKTAPVTIIAFEDFQCPYCQTAEPIIQSILQQYPTKVRFVYRDFPLYTIHPQATAAAQAGECADEQGKFWQWHDLAFAHQSDIATANVFSAWATAAGLNSAQFNACVTAERYKTEVQKDQDDGFLAGVDATPTWFINGTKIKGVPTEQQWKDLIDAL